MDTLRNDDDREINHHGKTITINDDTEDKDEIGSIKVIDTNKDTTLETLTIISQVKPANLVSVNEKEELEAQREFYKKIEMEMGKKRSKQLERLKKVNLVYLPLMALIFAALFWFVGLKNAEII